jgi:hypothetical protein
VFKRNVCFTVLIVVALLAAVVLSACAGAAPKQHTLKVFGESDLAPEKHLRENDGTANRSVGDRGSGSREVFDESGKKVGELDIVGVHTDPVDEPDEVHHRMLTMVVLLLEDGSTIVSLGPQSIDVESLNPGTDVATERPIVGGTGKYVGASGVLATQRADDGTYTYTFTFTTPQ